MIKKRYKKGTLSVLFLCLEFFLLSTVSAETPKSISQIARSGAPSLAMHILDQKQKYLTKGSDSFLKYEQQRHQILGRWKQWQKGLDRFDLLPKEIPSQYKSWVQRLKVIYHIELAQYDQALFLVRELLFNEQNQSKEQFSFWQKLVIRIYLKQGLIQDAEKAMLRYQQDYQDQELNWLLLQSEILIRSGRSEEVLEIGDKKDSQFLLLKMLAQLKSKTLPNELIYEKAKTQAEKKINDEQLQAKFWLLAARASYISGNKVKTALSYDKVASLGVRIEDELFPFSGDQLWDAYLDLGHNVGNKKRLLVGDDEKWFKEVERSLPDSPLQAKSLLSVIALQSSSNHNHNQNRAYKRLVELILNYDDGLKMLQTLFLNSERFDNFQAIPYQVRYVLIDDALEKNNIVEASKLISELKKPEGVDEFKWELRRARVLIMGSNYKEGADILKNIIKVDKDYSTKQLDQITQVLFDLQSVEQHKLTIELFELLLKRTITPKRKREIWFWQAQSYHKMAQYQDAALMYFKSAYYTNEHASDLWGQTARFNAAESLAEAGLTGDAQRTLEELLKYTKNKKRRSVIQSRLKGLWLKLKNESDIASN